MAKSSAPASITTSMSGLAIFFAWSQGCGAFSSYSACQAGGTLQLARDACVEEVVAIEGRAFNVEKAKLVQHALGVENIAFLEGDLETFDFQPLGRFDAAYCVGLLYHLPNPWELLTRLAGVTDVVYINTHYCPRNEATLSLGGYAGKKWQEFGYQDPLSGLSPWSFWPTLDALVRMLEDAGFLPEIFETESLGLGQSPHGATLLARRMALYSKDDRKKLRRQTERVLASLPVWAGSLKPRGMSGLERTFLGFKRIVRRVWKK